jgi:hypothetical protein
MTARLTGRQTRPAACAGAPLGSTAAAAARRARLLRHAPRAAARVLTRSARGRRQTPMRRGLFRAQDPEAVARVRPQEYMEYPTIKPVNMERGA